MAKPINNLKNIRQIGIVNTSGRHIKEYEAGNIALHNNPLGSTPKTAKAATWLGDLLGTAQASVSLLGDLGEREYQDALVRAKGGDYSVKGGWLGNITGEQQKAQDQVKGEVAGQQAFAGLHVESLKINKVLAGEHKDKTSAWKVNEHHVRLEKAMHSLVSKDKSPEYVAAFLSKIRPYGNKLANENLQKQIASDKSTFINNTETIVRKSLAQVSSNLSPQERTKKIQENIVSLHSRVKAGGYSEYDSKIIAQKLILEHVQSANTQDGADLLRDLQGKEEGKWITDKHIEQTERIELRHVELTDRRKRVQQNVNYSSVQESLVKTELALEANADITDPEKRSETLGKLKRENNKRLLALRNASSGTYSAEQYSYLSKRAQAIKDTIASGGVMSQIPQEALTRLRELQFNSSPEASEEMKQIYMEHAGKQLPKDLYQSRSFTLNRTEQERRGKEQATWNSMSLNLLNNIQYKKYSDMAQNTKRQQRQEATQYMSELIAEAKETHGNVLGSEAEKEIRDKFAVKFPPRTEDQKIRAESLAVVKKVLSVKDFDVKELTSESSEAIKTANPRELQELRTHFLKEGNPLRGWKVLIAKAGIVPKNLVALKDENEKKKEFLTFQKGSYYSNTKQLLESKHTYTVASKTFGGDTLDPYTPVEMQMVFVEDIKGKRSLIKFSERGQEDKVLTSPFTDDTKVLIWEKAKSRKVLGFIPAGGIKAGYKIKLMKDITPEELEQLNSVKLETFPFDVNKPRYNQNSLSRVERDKVPRRAYHNRPVGLDPSLLTLNLSSASLPLKDHYVILETEPNSQSKGWELTQLKDVPEKHKGNIVSLPIDPNLVMSYEIDKGLIGGKEKKVGKLIDMLKGVFKGTLLSAKPLNYMQGRELHTFINPEQFK